jgi:hypothetical protein
MVRIGCAAQDAAGGIPCPSHSGAAALDQVQTEFWHPATGMGWLAGRARSSLRVRTRGCSMAGPAVESLAEGVGPLRAWFNAHQDHPRFLTIMSPT